MTGSQRKLAVQTYMTTLTTTTRETAKADTGPTLQTMCFTYSCRVPGKIWSPNANPNHPDLKPEALSFVSRESRLTLGGPASCPGRVRRYRHGRRHGGFISCSATSPKPDRSTKRGAASLRRARRSLLLDDYTRTNHIIDPRPHRSYVPGTETEGLIRRPCAPSLARVGFGQHHRREHDRVAASQAAHAQEGGHARISRRR